MWQTEYSGDPGRAKFAQVLARSLRVWNIPRDLRVLIIGGCTGDELILKWLGFRDIVNSNHPTDLHRLGPAPAESSLALDAENLSLADGSFDLVFTYDVLHHCRSPHRALCEMLRVASRYVVFHEPNDSAFMRLLGRWRLSDTYELPAVFDNDCRLGGVNNLPIPNHVYRWNTHEAGKTASSSLAEYRLKVHGRPYWAFRQNRRDLLARRETHLGTIISWVGARPFLAALRVAEPVCNLWGPLRSQGNKFLCCIDKTAGLQPWLQREGGAITIRRDYRETRKRVADRRPNR